MTEHEDEMAWQSPPRIRSLRANRPVPKCATSTSALYRSQGQRAIVAVGIVKMTMDARLLEAKFGDGSKRHCVVVPFLFPFPGD